MGKGMNMGHMEVFFAPVGTSVPDMNHFNTSGHSGTDWVVGGKVFGPEEAAAREAMRLLVKMPVKDASTRECRDRTVIESTTYFAYGSIADDVREVFGAHADTEVLITSMRRSREGMNAYVKCSLSVVCAGDLMTFDGNGYDQYPNMMELLGWLDESRKARHVEAGGTKVLLDGFL